MVVCNKYKNMISLSATFYFITVVYYVSQNTKEKKLVLATNSAFLIPISLHPEAEFKEFEPRLKFKPRLKYGCFHLKLYLMFQDLSRRSIETGFWQI